MEAGSPISALELLYPLLQGYDSVAVGPTWRSAGPTRSSTCSSAATSRPPTEQPPQSILTMPILPGTDGVQKMSKSLGNYVGVTDPPEEMFGRLMRDPGRR